MNAIGHFVDLVNQARSIAVLTGAGMSTASGIPDFRSASGIYSDEGNVNVFDLDAFYRDPSIFYRFARAFYPQVRDAQPNAAHRALAAWQKQGKALTIATQNVDDLHQRAESSPVWTVHGNYANSSCQSCGSGVMTDTLMPEILGGNIPRCNCGGVFKPDITFFGEMLPERDWQASAKAVEEADLVLVLGSSLVVHPAASLPAYRRTGTPLVIVNHDPTPLDGGADLILNEDLCSVMGEASRHLGIAG